MTSISSKHYLPGDVIQVCEPFVHLVTHECKGKYCDNCLAVSASLKKCANCSQMFYCDRKCQLRDWKHHKLECQLFAKYPQQLKQFIEIMGENCHLMLLRLYLQLNACPNLATKKYSLFNGSERCFNELLSHEEDLKPKFNEDPYCVQFFSMMQSFGYELSIDYYHRLLGQIVINSFGLFTCDNTQKEIGSALYVAISVFNHSCQPNAIFLNSGPKMQIRAMDTIKPGDEILLCYIPIDRPKIDRQKLLNLTKCFECRCVKCESDWDAKFDYEKFREMHDEYSEVSAKISENKNRNCEQLMAKRIRIGEQILVLKKELYQCYNHNIGCDMFTHSLNLLDAMTYGMCGQTPDSVTQFIQLSADYIKITHGIDHGMYRLLVHIAKCNHIPINK